MSFRKALLAATVVSLPLGSTALTGDHATMRNLIGDDDGTPALTQPGAHLHLYGKGTARPGRKMGHVTTIERTVSA